jgi:hypothetical protein
VFAVAAETGWPEERILFMPLARLAQYQHCLLRRNGVRTHRVIYVSNGDEDRREFLHKLKRLWQETRPTQD